MPRTNRALWSVLALFLFFAPGLAHASSCTPSFPLEENKTLGWEGADAAYSILLPDGRDVWIFGDTLYGTDRSVTGHDPRQVHNSLGISTCDAKGNWHLNYVVKHDRAGHAESYFSPVDPQHWYWAMDGFMAHGDLWVTLLCIRHAATPSPWAMDFETCGSDLAQVSHLDRDPQDWEVSIHPLVPDGVKAYPSAATVVRGDYAYLFALYESGTRPLLVTRLPLNGLDNPAGNLEYLATDDTWKHGFDPSHAKEVMKNGNTELSIRYHSELKEWLAVMVEPNGFSDKVLLRTAPDLTGPWTEGQVVYHMPEMLPGPSRDKNVFCYAGKEHPELEDGRKLLFTYVCNTMDVPSLVTNRKIYHPQVVLIPLPHEQDER
ncbi:DUF4185 domain-containing protein [Edaphobacter bradus]|uniref:DUF4185 domain-containing protein n=1 Tax=Edaphobacter bradus TaxID=2259016 RepID=UPI0021E07374|nr:DUF4185 domain-containing protein [Edaphobacter bradus]